MSFSEKLQTGFMGIISVLMVPIMLLNLLGGIVSGIWLAILGEWGVIGRGIFFIFISSFLISIALMPALLFAGPAAMALERGKKMIGMIFGALSILYTVGLITIWCIWVLVTFVNQATTSSIIPMLIWSYGIALAPWMYLAQKDQQGGGNEFSIFTTFFAQVAYIITIILVLAGADLNAILITFGAIMIIGSVLQVVIAFGSEIKKSFASKEAKGVIDVLNEIEKKIGNSGFDHIKTEVEKILLAQPKKSYKQAVEKNVSPHEIVYTTIAKVAAYHVGSGNYHIYRGVLNTMGPGEDLLKLFDLAIDELVKMDAIDSKQAKQHKKDVREEIEMMG